MWTLSSWHVARYWNHPLLVAYMRESSVPSRHPQWRGWKIASKVKLFILSEVPDNVAANGRRKAFLATVLPRNCLYAGRLGCTVHRVHRIVCCTIDEDGIVGSVHAIAVALPTLRCGARCLPMLRRRRGAHIERQTRPNMNPLVATCGGRGRTREG